MRIILSLRQLKNNYKKSSLPSPFYFKNVTNFQRCPSSLLYQVRGNFITPSVQTLSAWRRLQRDLCNRLSKLTFISVHGGLKLLSCVLLCLHRYSVNCWRCYVSRNSKPSLRVTYFSRGIYLPCTHEVYLLTHFCFSFVNLSFISSVSAKNSERWRENYFSSPIEPERVEKVLPYTLYL